MFSHMIAYHDPELYNHLDNNMFYPDVSNACSEEVTYLHSISILQLYAIPWFLTMFTRMLQYELLLFRWH